MADRSGLLKREPVGAMKSAEAQDALLQAMSDLRKAVGDYNDFDNEAHFEALARAGLWVIRWQDALDRLAAVAR